MVIGVLLGVPGATRAGPRAVRVLVGASAGSGDRGRGRGCCSMVVVDRWRRSAGRGLQRFELAECCGELGDPRPVVVEAELRAASGERELASDVKELVAEPLGFGLGELAVERQGLGPYDQVVREHHDLQPHLVQRELLERELLKAGVLVVADAVLDVRVLAVATLDVGDVLVGLVGQDRLEAVAVMVGERELRAGVRALAPDDQPDPVAQADRSTVSVIPATSPLSRMVPSWSSAGTQASSRIWRIACRTGSVSS